MECSPDGWYWDINIYVGDIYAQHDLVIKANEQYELSIKGINERCKNLSQRMEVFYEKGLIIKPKNLISWEDEAIQPTEQEGKERRVAASFDGKTMGQWRGYCKDTIPGAWGISDGAIFLSGSGKGKAGGRDGGDIITQKKFSNFELSLEWKISEGGNSGIFYLGQEECATGSTKRQPIFRNAPGDTDPRQ